MKAPKRKSASIPNSRWLAYATAGAASAVVSGNSAEGHIHYSGKINSDFRQEGFGTIHRSFALSQGRVFWLDLFVKSGGPYFNYALFSVPGGRFRGLLHANYWWNAGFIEKLHEGQVVSHGPFRPGWGFLAQASSYALPHSQWTEPGTGFLAFEFRTHDGTHYGWARLRVSGEPENFFELVDYAWGDAGDAILAGQTADGQTVKTSDSAALGWLALGAVGVTAWRKRRQFLASAPIP
jgi:hypothetical protein